MFLLCLCCCADSPLLPYTRGLAMPESGAVVEFPIGPSATPSLATRTAPTFLTSSSINNARASRLSNPFNAQLCALSLPTLIWRDIFIAAIPVLNVFLSTCPVEKESRSVERVVPRSLRGRLKSPTAQRLACRSVYAFFFLFSFKPVDGLLCSLCRWRCVRALGCKTGRGMVLVLFSFLATR